MKKKYDFIELDKLKKKLDAMRPLDTELYSKLRHKFNVDWTYHSNAIEGNTLSLSETRFFLEVGLTSKGKPLSEYLEIKNHKHALDYLETVIRDKEPLSEWLIKELHAMLFEKNEEYEMENELGQKIKKSVLPGKYKEENNYVLLPDGSRKFYINPLQTVDAMQDLIKFYNEEKERIHPVELAAKLHAQFVAIHPFVDGNGRVARLIMNLILMQAGYEPAIIQNDLKQNYYEALRHFDKTESVELFVPIIEQELIRTFQITLQAADGQIIFDKSDVGKRLETFNKAMKALEKDIGTHSKKVSDEDKKKSIKSLLEYLKSVAEEKIESFNSELFQFQINYPIKSSKLQGVYGMLDEHNIIAQSPFSDFLAEKNEGSAIAIELISKRSYIPSSFCYFTVIPTKYTLCVCWKIDVSALDFDDGEIFDENVLMKFIQNGVLWEDWDKNSLDNLFNEVFGQFLATIEEEAEKRRLHMEENK